MPEEKRKREHGGERDGGHEIGGHRRERDHEEEPGHEHEWTRGRPGHEREPGHDAGDHRRSQDPDDPGRDGDRDSGDGGDQGDSKGKGKAKQIEYDPVIEDLEAVAGGEVWPSHPADHWEDDLFRLYRGNALEAWNVWEKDWFDRPAANPEVKKKEAFKEFFGEGLSEPLDDWYRATGSDPFDRPGIRDRAGALSRKIEAYHDELRKSGGNADLKYFERPLELVAYELTRELRWLDEPGASLIEDFKKTVGLYGDDDFHKMLKAAGKSKSLSKFWQKMKGEHADQLGTKSFDRGLSDTLDRWNKAWRADEKQFDAKKVFRLTREIHATIDLYIERLEEMKPASGEAGQLQAALRAIAKTIADELRIGEDMGLYDQRGGYHGRTV